MNVQDVVTSEDIRAARRDNTNIRERDLADKLGVTEAQLVAAQVGFGATRIVADMDRLIPAIFRLGEVMALTRNDSCVIEKVGVYDKYTGGQHASMIVSDDIDMRMFPRHWVYGFAVEKETDKGVRRSIQVFDAAGDAVHKVHLRDASDLTAWDALVDDLRLDDQSDMLKVDRRSPVEPAKGDPARADELRTQWEKLTDTHQFLQLTRKMGMNRLGAYRIAGAPFARPLATDAVSALLYKAAGTDLPIMVFVGNAGCIEIHTGPINRVVEMGPWINVLDPGFDLHLRMDHIAEVWAVTKNTRRGPAISVEAFDSQGGLITQVFGVLRDPDAAARWGTLISEIETEKAIGA